MVLLSTENISTANKTDKPAKKLEPKFIGPYKIIEQVNDNAFRLDLPPTMRHHPVFNADLLRPYKSSPPEFGDRTPPRPPPDIVDGEEEYEIDRILDHKKIGRTQYWKVKWKGYPAGQATWETKSAFTNAKDIFEEYEARRRKK
jgi:hypothetical protein